MSGRRVAALLVFLFVGAATATAAPPVSAGPPAGPRCAPERPDLATALATARACGQRVEAAAMRSPTVQAYVNPDGTTTVEESLEPQRVRRPNGSWVRVDATLRKAPDGSVVPAATVESMVFSGGGDAPFARLTGSGGTELALSWPARLPAPVLDGDTAVYREVLAGVDLRVTAIVRGFSHVLVVRDRAAAANPALRQLTFGLSTKGLTVVANAGGGLEVRDRPGRTVFAAPAPLMWEAGDENGRRQAVMPVRLERDTLVITPDRDLLTDPATRFPVTIDPQWPGYIAGNAWTTVWENFPNSSFWQNGNALNNAGTFGGMGSGRTCDHSDSQGNCISPTYRIRTLFRMDLSGVQGKVILGAQLRIEQRHAWTCGGGGTNAKVWLTGGISPGTTWNNQPWWDPGRTAEVRGNHRVDSRFGCAPPGFIEFNVTGIVDHAVRSGWGDVTLGLQAGNEGTTSQWKRFRADSPVLVITYNTIPNAPDSLTVDGRPCPAGSARPFISTSTPTLRARVTDADNDSMQVWMVYAYWNAAENQWKDLGGGPQDQVPNGGTAQRTATGLADENVVYSLRAQSNDYRHASPLTSGCEWRVDLTDPTAPAVGSDLYRENSAGCPPTGCGGVGQTGSFTFTSSPDVVAYRWGFSDPPSATVTAPAEGAATTVAWTPTSGGPKTLFVQAIDHSGRTTRRAYQFTVAGPSPAVARWRLDEPAGTTTLADTTGNGHTATLNGGTLGVPGRYPGGDTVLALSGVTSEAYTADPVIDTSRSFSVATWAKLADTVDQWGMVYQDGTAVNAFDLEYWPGDHAWKFAFSASDEQTTTWTGAVSTTRAAANVWTHVVGVYDAGTREARLYVNGRLEGRLTGVTPWKAPGRLHIGGIGGASKGALSDVQVWDRVLVDDEVAAMAAPVPVGEYHLSEVNARFALDSSGLGHDLTLHGGAAVPPAGSGHSGTGMHLDGATGYADAAGPVLRTDQSYTVSAWVRLGDGNGGTPGPDLPIGNRTAVGQSGQWVSGFFLGLRYLDGVPRWSFTMKYTDADSGPWVHASAPTVLTPADVGRWVHLVGVYDAATNRLSLYLNGTLAGSATRAAAPWHADGPLTVGGALWSPAGGPPRQVDHWLGDLDEVRVYAGAVVDGNVA